MESFFLLQNKLDSLRDEQNDEMDALRTKLMKENQFLQNLAGKTNSVYFDAYRSKAYDGGGEENLTFQVRLQPVLLTKKKQSKTVFFSSRVATPMPVAAWTPPPGSSLLLRVAPTSSSSTSPPTTTRRPFSQSGEKRSISFAVQSRDERNAVFS